ncbi:MAG: hypothetical protein KGI33_08345 [Thaumarchaeota archaeon]|nr:hypothetical protein [Nitrososphaerota archaeon]
MTEVNHAGNIIVSLANLPDFLRRPILQKRLSEFFSLSREDRTEIVNNALLAGPAIQFDRFGTLFKTWLEILCILSEEQRMMMFGAYIDEIVQNPAKIVPFNLDGILEIYLMLPEEQRKTISSTIKKILDSLEERERKRILPIIPERAKKDIGV